MDKAGIANRLSKAGLRNVAEAYREEVRQRIARDAGPSRGKGARDRDAVSAAAWTEMWETFRPVVERIEAEVKTGDPPAPQLAGLPEDTASLLDPNYTETDPGKQLRDGWLWVVFEWVRVIQDTPEGPVASIAKASTPPPNAFALLTLSTYALSGIDKRRELISRALSFATKEHDPIPEPASDTPREPSYLDSL